MFPARRCGGGLVVAGGTLAAPAASAHSFAVVYTPPIPFWMYAWGASAALLASFAVFGLFLREAPAPAAPATREIMLPATARPALWLGRVLSLGLLLLCIATGLFGDASPYGNFNLTFFWIVFALGGLYLTALLGNLYAWLNPWRVLADGLSRLWPAYGEGRRRYPAALGAWPALGLYLGFIWIELFARHTPHALAVMLLAYTGLNLAGVALIGRRVWFRHCELFSVMFRLVGSLAPLRWRGAPARVQLRPPLSGSIAAAAPGPGLLLFILFMLSSTAFDGLKDSLFWQRLFWVDLYHAALKPYVGSNPLAAIPQMRMLAGWWHSGWLLLSPLLYLAAYWLCVALGRWLARDTRPTRQLARDFAATLLPIALVYHVTHYYTLIPSQGVKILRLASDPFGRGWDLFGTAGWLRYSIVPDANLVWHVQVVLIVLGHIASVYLAHRVALRVFGSRRQALLSQVPMLLLMLAFTSAGLWVLSLPPAAGG